MQLMPILLTLLLGTVAYIFGYFNCPHVCTAMIVATFYSVLITFFIIIMSLLCPKLKDELSSKKKRIIYAVIICLILFKIAAWAINSYYFASSASNIRVMAKGLAFLVAVIVAMNLACGRRIKIITPIIVLIVLSSISAPFICNGKSKDKPPQTTQPLWKQLNTIPYAHSVPDEDDNIETGVIIHDHDRAFKGLNIWFPLTSNRARLMDMNGESVHEWQLGPTHKMWRAEVELLENGDLLGMNISNEIVRLDWDSNVKWINSDFEYHHEISVSDNGDIFSLGRKARVIFVGGLPLPIRDDYIVTLSAKGKLKNQTPLLNTVRDEITVTTCARVYWHIIQPGNIKKMIKQQLAQHRSEQIHSFITPAESAFDVMHANTLTVLDRTVDGLCEKGDLLICIRNLDKICIFNIESKKLSWQWSPGKASRPHHPTLTDNDTILIFDNGPLREYSRIIEVDPFDKKVVWEYKANPPEMFHSKVRGSSQRLPNGNTLITESDKGHVFEITSDGTVVWSFLNGELDPKNKKRAAIYRMFKVIEPEKYHCLDRLN